MNPRRQSRLVYSQIPLATRALTRRESYSESPPRFTRVAGPRIFPVPTFDVVSEIDLQEVRNAVDQANREASTRFDFKNTNAKVEFSDKELTLGASTEDRLRALYQLLEEKLVKRSVSLKSLDPGKVEEASQGAARQKVALKAGISQEVGKQINKLVKDMGVKSLSSSIQGDQVRISGKQRDDLQRAIAMLKESEISVPLQFTNFRD